MVAALPGRPASADDPKIMGSAQRRLAGVVLQHGSLLLHANMSVGPAARHVGIHDLLPGGLPEPRTLAAGWLGRVARGGGAGVAWQAQGFLAGREAEVAETTARFQDPRWTDRR